MLGEGAKREVLKILVVGDFKNDEQAFSIRLIPIDSECPVFLIDAELIYPGIFRLPKLEVQLLRVPSEDVRFAFEIGVENPALNKILGDLAGLRDFLRHHRIRGLRVRIPEPLPLFLPPLPTRVRISIARPRRRDLPYRGNACAKARRANRWLWWS